MNTDLKSYYNERAKEYEKIYERPERQSDLVSVAKFLQGIFAGKNVLEIACGTGYWTERIAVSAASILATDINESVIDIAKKKPYASNAVSFEVADIYNFPPKARLESLFGGFIWSHIALENLEKLLATANGLVAPGGTVVFIDNNYVAGNSLPITSTDKYGNTFQARQLENGSSHLILKNFPDEKRLRQSVSNFAGKIDVMKLRYFWILSYTTPVG